MANSDVPTKPTAPAATEKADKPRLSFASIAALAASQPNDVPPIPTSFDGAKSMMEDPKVIDSSSSPNHDLGAQSLRESVARLKIEDHAGPVIASTDSVEQTPLSSQEHARYDDEKTHLSFISNPTVSTDVRSVVSGTTFAMDEKESIRPDDSASVKAAEEDDSTSGANSRGPQSVSGSEGGKAFTDQFNEVSGARNALPLTTSLVQRMPDETGRTGSSATAMAHVCPPPDEKLMDALQSQRDRMFLLQMEQQFIGFVKNSKEQLLHLPPCNAFCRLLAHRLADYYNLTHSADPNGSVRVGKTENPRLPPPLSEMALQQVSNGPASAPQPALRIMRRADRIAGAVIAGSSTGESPPSISPRPESESSLAPDGGEFNVRKGGSPTRDLKARRLEEREARYNARREELYRDIPDKSAEHSTAASRASSTLGSTKSKKKQPNNDDFEPRSVYTNVAYPRGQQQVFAFTSRAGPGPPSFVQSGPATGQDSVGLGLGQMSFGQAGQVSTEQAFGAGYSQEFSQPYYDNSAQGYQLVPNGAPVSAYGVPFPNNQQSLPGVQFGYSAHPGQAMQSMPNYVPTSYSPNYAGLMPGQVPMNMIYPGNFNAQQGYGSPANNQFGQYPTQHQAGSGGMAYHNTYASHQGIATNPAYFNGNTGTHNPSSGLGDGQLGLYSQGAVAMGNRNIQPVQGNVQNTGMRPPQISASLPAFPPNDGRPPSWNTIGRGQASRGGFRDDTRGNAGGRGSHRVEARGNSHSQARGSSRVDDYIVPRQGSQTAPNQQDRQVSNHLKKYDKSSLPPKPPEPVPKLGTQQ